MSESLKRSAASITQEAAARHGVWLPDDAATAIARAVLEYADDERHVAVEVAREFWPGPLRDEVLRKLRRSLAAELADNDLLPVCLPREVVTRHPDPWEPVKVELVVPVRRGAK